jgi:C_GCAxxG_C_C family probable redox protein
MDIGSLFIFRRLPPLHLEAGIGVQITMVWARRRKEMTGKSKDEIFEVLDQKAQEYLEMCGNCAQTTFLTLQEQFELEDDGAILKALTPFPGIALRGETCGVVTGSLMALGLIYGRDRDKLNDFRSYQRSLPSARRFCRNFEDEVGSTMCDDIVEAEFGRSYDLADPMQAMEWMNDGAVEKCGAVIRKGVRIAAEIIMR